MADFIKTKTQLEMEAGALRTRLYEQLYRIDKAVLSLQKRFPTLRLNQRCVHPYTHITLWANSSAGEQGFEELLEEFPSDLLVTKLMLMS